MAQIVKPELMPMMQPQNDADTNAAIMAITT
jgi:hypothetical protein